MSDVFYERDLWNGTPEDGSNYTSVRYCLKNIIKCEVVQVLNGMYQCAIEYPEDETPTIEMYGNIYCKIPNISTMQRFIVHKIEKRDHICYITAYHISYRMSWVGCTTGKKFSAGQQSQILAWFKENAVDNGFNFYSSGVSGVPAITFERANTVWGNMISFANTIGAFWTFDNKKCYLKGTGQTYSSTVLRYDKNLSSFSEEIDGIDSYYRIIGCYSFVADDGEYYSYYGFKSLGADASKISPGKTLYLDVTDQFPSTPTSTAIASYLDEFVEENPDLGSLRTTYDFSIIPIDGNIQYQVGDYIRVELKNATRLAQIRRIVMDVLTDQVTIIETDNEANNIYSNVQSVSNATIQNDDTKYVKIVTYSGSYNISGNGRQNIVASSTEANVFHFNIKPLSGYTPIAIGRIATGNQNIVMRAYNCKATGSSAVLSLVNVSSTAYNDLTATIDIIYFKKEHITT